MSATDWRIPPSVTRWLAEAPVNAPVREYKNREVNVAGIDG